MTETSRIHGQALRFCLMTLSIVGSTNLVSAQYPLGPDCCGGSDLAYPTFKPGSILPPRPWFPRLNAWAHGYGHGGYGHGGYGYGGYGHGYYPYANGPGMYGSYPAADPAFAGYPLMGEEYSTGPVEGCCDGNGIDSGLYSDGVMPDMHHEAPYRPMSPPNSPTPLTPQSPNDIPLPSLENPPIRATPSWPNSGPTDSFRPRSPAPPNRSAPTPAPATTPTPVAPPAAEPIPPRTPEPTSTPDTSSSTHIELPGTIEFTNEVVPLPQDARRPGNSAAAGRFRPVPGAARAWYANSQTVVR